MVLVAEAMTKNPVCTHPDDLITRARSLMRKRGFRALPVVDKKLIGMISRSDVLRVTSSKSNLRVSGLMSTNIVSVRPDDDLFVAAEMIVSSGVRQLPVVHKTLQGIVSSLDILEKFVEEDYTPKRRVIGGFMCTDVVCCGPDDELSGVWGRMSKIGFSGLPVVKKGVIIGMVTMNDILKHGKARLSKESGKARSIGVEKVMSTPAITADVDMSTKEVAGVMVRTRILRVPLVRENKLAGIVDVEDILRAYIGG